MLNELRIGVVAVAMVALSGCAVKDGWKGASAESAYDKELAAIRLAEDLNNDDYWEIQRPEENRIYVIADLKSYQVWLSTGEIPLVSSKIGVGPNGETLKLALVKDEAKAMETKVGFKGGAERMYFGETKGLDKGFYGEVHKAGTIYVFNKWAELEAFKKGAPASGQTQSGAGPKGETVVWVGGAGADADTKAKFAKAYGK
ncbi:hypothetical protein C3942_04115 [Solimonas fluminis]|uniref:Lipoprotein n=1 Tax=Solimonas fluminis TaxID=2086571 RepID=A0A2S5TJ82_9GAMM|nr:hypothetical protein [Solimonas fluminis]PPE74868.1 hypothetical protein C3942_04115 [Solimonas fluminis]